MDEDAEQDDMEGRDLDHFLQDQKRYEELRESKKAKII